MALTAMGIGTIVGTGIFVFTGIAAATQAGPALTISFVVAGIVSALAALCYAEVASSVPIAGSAYTYAYATVGELLAWIIGWDLMLEYGVGASTVSIGWSGAFVNFFQGLGWNLPARFVHSPFDLTPSGQSFHGLLNLPAAAIVLAIAALLIKGSRESSIVNAVIVVIKLGVIGFFLAVAIPHVHPANWHPYMPFGWHGVFAGAAFIFFAYIGFDSISTAAEETKNPQRDLPIGIMASLGFCTILYVVVVAVLTGVTPYRALNVPSPVSQTILSLGYNFAAALVAVGIVCGLTTVLLTQMFAQSRILFAMSRDGLVLPAFSKIHPRFRTPAVAIASIALIFAFVAAFTPIAVVSELSSIGTLIAFTLTAIAVPILRKRHPDLKRGFRVPLVPYVPIVSVAASLFLVTQLHALTLIGFVVWLAAGLVVYFAYGRRRSIVAARS